MKRLVGIQRDLARDLPSVESVDTLSRPSVVDTLPGGVAVVDTSGIIRYANDRLCAMSARERDGLLGRAVAALVPRLSPLAESIDGDGPVSIAATRTGVEMELVRRDGSELPVDVTLSSLSVGDERWTVALIRDDTERRMAQQLHALSELPYRLAFEENMAPMAITDVNHRAVAVNEAFCRMLGYRADEILGTNSQNVTHPDDVGITEEARDLVTTGVGGQVSYVKRYMHRDGRVIVVEVSRSPARDAQGNILYFVVSQRDITEKVERDRLLRLMGKVNRLATYATDANEFLQQICDAMVEEGGFSLAWVASLSDNAPGAVDVVCSAGATDYLDVSLAGWWGTKQSAFGPSGAALRSRQSQVVNDLRHHEDFKAWGETATRFGFGSMVAIPGAVGPTSGALVVYHRDVFAFDHVTVAGLEEIVREVQLALVHVRAQREIADSLRAAIVANEELIESKKALGMSEQRFRLSFESNMAPMVLSDHDDLTAAVNDAFCEMVGFSREELLGRDSAQYTHPDDVGITENSHRRLVANEISQARYVKRYLRKDGRIVICEVSRSAARDETGQTLYFLSSERDITEERALASQLSHQVLHDLLTGLANRVLFEDRLAQSHAGLLRDGGLGAIMLLNLDDFKSINEAHGHVVGDELIVAVAQRLEEVTRATDTLCRLGADEFLYLAAGLNSVAEVDDIANRLLEALNAPFLVAGVDVRQHASMGIVLWDATRADSRELIQNANEALRESKEFNRGSYTLFASRMHERAVNRFTLVQELRRALPSGDVSMYYQPIVSLASTSVVGFEALMRWRHPERGFVAPDTFIPLAEKSNLIIELGNFALREAAFAARAWDIGDNQDGAPYVTVNLSAHQFHHRELVATIEEILGASGLSANRLILEITEGVALLDRGETLEVMERLRDIGVGIALDDFGTGFSSLSYLTRLQPRIIKIDKSFVSPSNESRQIDTLLEAIISLGAKLDMTMLAEGIETAAQLEQLRHLSCELGQGYLFSRAVPVEETRTMLTVPFS